MKNEQLMIYILIAILYGAVGFLLYKKYQSKEKYIGNCADCDSLTGNDYINCFNNCCTADQCCTGGVCTSNLN